MKLGITGLTKSGRSTVFAALTGARGDQDAASSHTDSRIATVTVPDKRVDFLKEIYKPKKTIYSKVEYFLPSEVHSINPQKKDAEIWNQLKTCDALLHIVRNFQVHMGASPSPAQDFQQLEEEMLLSDLAVVEKRIERLALDRKRGKKPGEEEATLMESCMGILENGEPLRNDPTLANNPLLKGFTFLSAKPMLVIINNEDDVETYPNWPNKTPNINFLVVRGNLEKDIAIMSEDEAGEFLEMYNIKESALDRVIRSSYSLLKLISFFTVGSDEVKAWPIKDGTLALDAAGTIHSDIKQGFIRAETLFYGDLKVRGSFQQAKKAGLVRLEGKEYIVKDGDIMNFRFNI